MKVYNFLVKRCAAVLAVMLALAVVCGVLMFGVGINSDLTKYLPDDSEMRRGMELMEEHFQKQFAEINKAFFILFKVVLFLGILLILLCFAISLHTVEKIISFGVNSLFILYSTLNLLSSKLAAIFQSSLLLKLIVYNINIL